MTRGYVCIVEKGKKIKSVAYLQSDAYLSGYGSEILEGVCNGTIDDFMEKQIKYNHKCYGKDEPNENFSLNWIAKSKETVPLNRYEYAEYGYLYNESTGVLKVYNYGELYFTVPNDTAKREKYKYFFQNYSEILQYLRYDETKLAYDYKKNVKALIDNADIDTLKVWFERAKTSRLELDDTHCILAGHTDKNPVYRKQLSWSDSHDKVTFIVNKEWHHWYVLIQLPFVRATILRDFASETAAVNAIRKLAVQNQRLLRSFAKISREIKEAYTNNEHEVLDNILATLKDRYKEDPWFTAAGAFTVDRIRSHYLKF